MGHGNFCLVFLTIFTTVYSACRYEEMIFLGQEFWIYNEEYEGNYTRGTNCVWIARSQPGTQIVLSCSDVNIPYSRNCQFDKLSISLTGSSNFDDAKNYCGEGTITLVSKEQSLSVGLFSPFYSPFYEGGRFVCSVTAIRKEGPTTTTQKPPVRCDCGWKQGMRITGGTETGINEFPFMAGIKDALTNELFCGASIISERYVLSAAHCFLERPLEEIELVVGEHNVTSATDTPYASVHRFEDLIVHPEYYSVTQTNDIAIAKTYGSIRFSMYVGPVCLPFKYSNLNFEGEIVKALGWGSEEFSGPRSQVLQKVDLNVISNTQCVRTEKSVTYSQLCTYSNGKDTCQSDSGGPITWTSPSRRYTLVGIISYGLGCGTQRPSVNTRVTTYLSWIISQTSDSTYCVK